MTRRLILISVIVTAFLGSFLAKRAIRARDDNQPLQATHDAVDLPPQKIVSLAPSITEILFGLGLGDRVVGVTPYCDHPPEATQRAKVGAYLDPNYEAIIALGTDLVILTSEQSDAERYLQDLGIEVMKFDQNSVSGIIASIRAIGERCGAAGRAATMIADIEARMKKIADRVLSRPKPRVLLVVERGADNVLKNVYIAGRGSWLTELLRSAGGINAYQGSVAYPAVSLEGIMQINPEIIIELVPQAEGTGRDIAEIRDDWQTVSHVDAVIHDRVYVLKRKYVVRPGPRFILILEALAEAIHPSLESLVQ